MFWIAVTADKYELPVIVADSSVELAEKLGTTPTAIRVRACKQQNGLKSGIRIYKVEDLEDEDLKEGDNNGRDLEGC